MFHMPNIDMEEIKVPAIFKIIDVQHVYKFGNGHFDSYMVVMNTANHGYSNKEIYAKTYKNGALLNCAIPTLNAHDFAGGSHHYDVQKLVGAGGETWYAGATIGIDYENGTFHPGDLITLEIYDRNTEQIISRDTFRA
jgi:hypothetical protein